MTTNKPTLIVTLSHNWNGKDLPIPVQYKSDMVKLEDKFKQDENWYKDSKIMDHDLNLIVTTDDSQFKYENLKYYHDIILRRNDEFLSMRKLESVYMKRDDLYDAIDNYQNLAFDNEYDFMRRDELKLIEVCNDVFPTLKQDLLPLYELTKNDASINKLIIEGFQLLLFNRCNIEVCQFDMYESAPTFKINVSVTINPDSNYIGWVSITNMLRTVIRDMSLIMAR